jgi:uncharacterized protein (DUF58 family)
MSGTVDNRTSRLNRLQRRFPNLARHAPVDSAGVARIGRRHIYILPTGAGLLLGAVLTLMLLGSLNYQNNLAVLFTFLMGSIAIVAMHHTWFNLLGLSVSARGGPPVFAGQDAVFTVRLEDDGSRDRPDLSVRIEQQGAAAIHVDAGSAGSTGVAVAAGHRGRLRPGRLRVETRYPLGLFRAWCYPRTDAWVTVYPRPAARSPAPSPVPVHGRSHQGDLGVGADDFVGPREYQTGDSPRRLDWKALARERGLVVKQFGGDRAAQVWLDWERLPAVDMESRLSLLCRQVLDAAENGLSYGLRLPGTSVPLGQGEVHKHRCLETLADYGHG